MYNVSVSPHIRENSSTSKIMLDVAIALIPTLAFGVYSFGINALLVIISSVVSCVICEAIMCVILKKPISVFDFSAVVTGLIIALNMPPEIAWWIPALGGVFAIVIVKMLFGGIGQNIINPALAARCFLLISFASRMTDFTVDGVSSATPLAALKAGDKIDLLNAFLGVNQHGCIGEVSILALLIGGAYLLIKKVINIRIPGIYIVSTLVFIYIINCIQGNIPTLNYMIGELCTGGLVAGAIFMATDYTTSPITKKGQIVYALLLGFLTSIFRVLGSSAEGVSYAIIISNLVVPLIEKVTIPKAFGLNNKKGA